MLVTYCDNKIIHLQLRRSNSTCFLKLTKFHIIDRNTAHFQNFSEISKKFIQRYFRRGNAQIQWVEKNMYKIHDINKMTIHWAEVDKKTNF